MTKRPFQILFDKDISFISIAKGLPNDSKTNRSVEDPEDQGLGQESVANGEPAEENPAAGEETIARHVVEEITHRRCSSSHNNIRDIHTLHPLH